MEPPRAWESREGAIAARAHGGHTLELLEQEQRRLVVRHGPAAVEAAVGQASSIGSWRMVGDMGGAGRGATGLSTTEQM